jgi:DNA-directed RNA polymerase specialized sigma24 family protein
VGRRSDGGSLAAIMERMAAGDPAAIFGLVQAHRPDLERAVRYTARSRGARLTPEQVDDLVLDAAIAIRDVAAAWKPEGAPPWVYARGRIANAVDRVVGQWADPLDPERTEVEEPPAASGSEPDTIELLSGLAAEHPEVDLLVRGLARVATPRDQVVFVEHGLQVALGDPSPAVTVANQYGMKPASVRQQARRVRLRLRKLAETDPLFGELARLPLVA